MFLKKFIPENNEKIIFQVHRHWIVLFKDIFLYTIIYIIIIFSFFWVYYNWSYDIQKSTGIPKDFILYTIGIILIVYSFFYIIHFWNKYIDWFYDVLILTDKRIVEINQKFLFGRETRSLPLDEITSVKSSHHGILGSILKFGILHIITASPGGIATDIVFDYVSNQEKLQNMIQQAKISITKNNSTNTNKIHNI